MWLLLLAVVFAPLVAENPLGPCTGNDIAEWHMAEASRIQAQEAYGDAMQAQERGENEIAKGTHDRADGLMDDADGYWAEIPAACQTWLIKQGD